MTAPNRLPLSRLLAHQRSNQPQEFLLFWPIVNGKKKSSDLNISQVWGTTGACAGFNYAVGSPSHSEYRQWYNVKLCWAGRLASPVVAALLLYRTDGTELLFHTHVDSYHRQRLARRR
jgi:hypothetical protein